MFNQWVLIDLLYSYNMGAARQLLSLIFTVTFITRHLNTIQLVKFSCPCDKQVFV